MINNLNANEISFSNNNNSLFNNCGITGSYNYIGDNIIKNKNNSNSKVNNIQAEDFQRQLNEYEQKKSKKNYQQFHFDFKGGLSNKTSNKNQKEDNNNNTYNNINNTNNNNNAKIQNNKNDFNIEDYPEDFLSNVVNDKACRIFTKANYIVFENKYGENSCYLNVLLHFLYNNKDIFSSFKLFIY